MVYIIPNIIVSFANNEKSVMDKSEHFRSGLYGGMVGACVIVALIIVVLVWVKPFNYKAVTIINTSKVETACQPILTVPESELIISLRQKELLLTPDEYTNNLLGYYDTLISFLAVLFVLFSILGYISIRSLSRKEIREEAREILQDSEKFKKNVIESLTGEFNANYVSIEAYDTQMKDLTDKVTALIDNRERKERVVKKTK